MGGGIPSLQPLHYMIWKGTWQNRSRRVLVMNAHLRIIAEPVPLQPPSPPVLE
jgi:hypothetical protein